MENAIGDMHCDLLAVDLDGTLLDSQHELPDANRAALHRAHEAGVKIVLCTGRAFTETRPVIAQIGLELDAAVTVFGALVTEVATGRTVHRHAIEPALARAATAWFHARDYPVLWLTDPDECGTDGFVTQRSRWHAALDRWLTKSPCCVSIVDEIPAVVGAPLRLSIIDSTDALDGISESFTTDFGERLVHNVLHAPPYDLALIEVFAAPVNKWYGVQQVCARWGIDAQNTVAVGDDVNDLAMIIQAGLGVAMGNAHPAIRGAARAVTATNDACGVARLVDALLQARRREH